MKKIPCMKSPCKDCPFRKDCLEGWLGSERMEGILNESSFVCHKDTSLQCAGHMLIKKDDNSFVRMANRLHINLYLKGDDLIFDTEIECIEHHKY